MRARTVAGRLVAAALVVIVVALLVGQIAGQPVLLSYVETGSMEPTLRPGDGFVAVPMAVAGPVEIGDIVVFEAEELHGGGLVTHRVVGETERGYITKGDANPVTDQDGSEPPVRRQQIVAEALQIGGEVVVIPGIGLAVTTAGGLMSALQQRLAILLGTRSLLGTQGLAYLLFAVGVIAYVVSSVLEGRKGTRARETTRDTGTFDTRLLIAALAVILVAMTTASMTVAAGTQEFGVVSSDTDAPGPNVIPTGGSENLTYRVPSSGMLPVVVFLEPASDGIEVTPRELYVAGGGRANATVTLHAPPENGYYRRFLLEHRYIAILPRSTIRALYAVHPWLPIAVIDALLAVAFVGMAVALVGTRPVRPRSRRGERSAVARLRRWLR